MIVQTYPLGNEEPSRYNERVKTVFVKMFTTQSFQQKGTVASSPNGMRY